VRRLASGALLAFVLLMGIDRPAPPFPGHAQWADLAIGVAMVALAIVWLRRQASWPLGADVTAAAMGYVLWAAVSAVVHRAGGWKVLGIVELVCVLVVTAELTPTTRDRDRLIRVWLIGSAVLGAFALIGAALAVAGVPAALYDPRGGELNLPVRARGLCVTSNLLASQLLAPLVLLVTDGRRWLGRHGRAIALALVATAFVMTLSRTFLAAALVLVLLRARDWRRSLLATLLVVAALASVRLDLYRSPDGTIVVGTAPGLRWRLARSAGQSMVEQPLFGVGPGAAPAHVEWPRPGDPVSDMYAHDTALGIAATLGVPALLAFLLLCAFVLREAGGSRDDTERVLVCALAATLFDGLTMDVQNFRHLWVLFGLVLSGPD
jgi:hypothetical protein